MCKAPRFDVCPTPAAAKRPSSIEQYSSQLRRAMVESSWYDCLGSTSMLSVNSQSLTVPLADPESSCCGFPLVDGRNDLLSTINETPHHAESYYPTNNLQAIDKVIVCIREAHFFGFALFPSINKLQASITKTCSNPLSIRRRIK